MAHHPSEIPAVKHFLLVSLSFSRIREFLVGGSSLVGNPGRKGVVYERLEKGSEVQTAIAM
jgi:hypothetical protein